MISPGDWRPTDGLELEPNALTAATAIEGSVVVAAGPGAGKTELLAQRADFVFRTGLCPYPRRILAISFKVDAARNLRERVRRRSGGQFAARFDSFTFHAFAKRIIDNYRPALTGDDALDPDYRIDSSKHIARKQITFQEMVPLALKILAKNPHARGGIRQTYSHVFFDEFQDATESQYELITTAFGESAAMLTAVGDTKQRIMVFAGALDGILQTFAEDFDATPLPLYQNRRSATRLRRMQNRIIADLDPGAQLGDSALEGGDGDIEVLAFATAHDEAAHLADLVQSQLNAGLPASEIAVLVRQTADLLCAELFKELSARGVPYRNEQAQQDLTAEPAASLILNLIRVIADSRQPTAYADLMRMSARPDTSEEDSLRTDRKLKRLLERLRVESQTDPQKRTDPAFWRSAVAEYLELVTRPVILALSPAYAQGDWLDEVLEDAQAAFDAALAAERDPAAAIRRLSDTEAVRVLTVHKAKGLEFKHVIVMAVEHEAFWGEEATEEFFVAISRAKQRLTLTTADVREQPEGHSGNWRRNRHARQEFLEYAIE